jgi:hypothetical protein
MKHDWSVCSLPDLTEHSLWVLRKFVVRYGRFGTMYRSPLQVSSSSLKMGRIDCPETNHRTGRRKMSEERRLYLHPSRSLKSRTVFFQRLLNLNKRKFPAFYGNNVHCRVDNWPPMVPNLSQINSVHNLSHSTSLRSHLTLSSYLRLAVQSRLFHTKTLTYLSSLSYVQHVLP